MSTASTPQIKFRPIELHDLPEIVFCENRRTYQYDPLFEVKCVPNWAWTEQDIVKAVRQVRNKELGTYETKAVAAEARGSDGALWVCGAFIYEIQEEAYEILFLTADPEAPSFLREKMIDSLIKKAEASSTRRKLVWHIQDGDWDSLKLVQDLKWSVKLIPEFFVGGNDAWRCVKLIDPQKDEEDETPNPAVI